MPTPILRITLIHCVLALTIILGTAKAAETTTPMLSYHRIISELANQDPTPLLRIYADGLAIVHIPSYMKQAGTYETQLSQAELQQLINEIRLAGLPAFDAVSIQSIRNQHVSQNANSGVLRTVSDNEVTVITLELPDGPLDAVQVTSTRSDFRWKNLQFDAKQFDIPALRAAAEAEQRLLGLVKNITPSR